jgi:alpha-beta hydrolase superfamily lysophospholipase
MLFQAGLANFARNSPMAVNLDNDERAPLLFISGGNDHAVPAAVQPENFQKQAKHSQSATAYKLFEGRGHCACGEQGWEAVANFALDWAQKPVAGDRGVS